MGTRIGVSTDQRGDLVVLAITGELDIDTAPVVETAIARVEQQRPATLLLDLRGLRFMDSTGLRVVLRAQALSRRQGRRLAIVPGPEAVHRVFRVAGLERRIEFVADPSTVSPPAAEG